MRSIRSRRALALGFVILVVSAGGGTALAISQSSSPDLSSPSPTGMATSIPSNLRSSFSALRTTRQQSDALPPGAAATVTGGPGQHYGINPSLSRLVGEVDGSKVWLVPGASGTCLYDSQSGGAVCTSNDQLSLQGAALLLLPTAGGQPILVGVLPDGASVSATDANGSEVPVAVSGGAFRFTGAAGGRVTIHGPSADNVLDIPSSSPSASASQARINDPPSSPMTAPPPGSPG